MVQHLFRQKTGLDHQAAHLGSEHDIAIARAERQHLPGKPEEEARSAADLARHHARLYDIAAKAKIAKPTFAPVKWGAGFGDFDNDGWPDFLIANGNFSSLMDSDRKSTRLN